MNLRLPVIRGVIHRRILVNYRVEPAVAAKLLEPPFRPRLVNGWAMAGICLIRLKQIRPRGLPAVAGIASENAAHRIAVEWEAEGERREGVFIPRRDTNARMNVWAGGRLFPGLHHYARFDSFEVNGQVQVRMHNPRDGTRVCVSGRVADRFPATSVFKSLEAASKFFEQGALGYSVTENARKFDGLELRSFGWKIEPLAVEAVESSFFANEQLFPRGSLEFDCALLMRDIEHEWHARPTLRYQATNP